MGLTVFNQFPQLARLLALVPGESRHFDIRLEIAAETSVAFECNEDFE